MTMVAITGGAGFIGRRLIDRLLASGLSVRALVHDRDIEQSVEKFPGSVLDSGALLPFLRGADTLFHLASLLGHRCVSQREFFRVNRDGAENVLRCAADAGVAKVVFFGSAGVYGRTSGLVSLAEDDEKHPVDAYERSKWAGEQVALAYGDRLEISLLRPGWVYGEGDRRTFKLIRQIASGWFFSAGSGRRQHSPIHVDDLVAAALLIAGSGKRGEVYNVGGPAIPARDMCRIIAALLGRRQHALSIPMALVYPAALALELIFVPLGREAPLNRAKLAFFLRGKPLNSEKIRRELGFVPAVEFEAGMERAIRWYRANGWLQGG